jgi:polysaccharide chain length determinant protein (PEP-CTERM system associated)
MLPGRQFTVSYILGRLWHFRWLIVTPLVLCTMTALIMSASLPDMYQADTLIQVVPQRIPDRFVPSTVTMKAEDRIEAVTHQVKSRVQLEALINEFDLYPKERQLLPMEDVIGLMRGAISHELVRANRNEPADAFRLMFTYTDADIATKVTQRLATLYIDRNARDRNILATQTDEFLENKLRDARLELEAQERKVKEFRERHAGRLPSQSDFNLQAIQSSSSQAQTLAESIARDRDRKLYLERLYNDARAEPEVVAPSPPPPPAAVAADPTAGATTLQQQLDQAQSALARASLRLKPEHPDVIKLTKSVADLERKVKEAAAAAPADGPAPSVVVAASSAQDLQRRERIQSMRAEIELLDRQIAFKETEERRHRAAAAEYQNRLEAVPGLESEWVALSRDYDTLNLAYRALLAKSQDAKVARDMEKDQIGEQFRVLDAARVPTRPIGPARLQLNAIGLGIGLLLGLGVVALLEFRDASFRTESDVFVLSLPVLAMVPLLLNEAEQQRVRRREWLYSGAGVAFLSVSGYIFWAMKLWKHVV